MSEPWTCPRCYTEGRTPVRLVIARMDDPRRDVWTSSSKARVCLRCADVLWHRLRKVLGPLVREPQ